MEIPYSVEFIHQLSRFRPGIDLVDEVLRSEHAPYIQDRVEVLVEPYPDRAGWRVLDFGCGAGGSSVVLARLGFRNIIAVDLVNDYAPVYRRRMAEAGFPGIGTFVQAGESFNLPFRPGSFDAIFLNGVLEHLLPEEREVILREGLRLLRSGGHILVAETPNRWFPRNSHTKIWFSELLPFRLAAAYAKWAGIRSDFPTGDRTALYRTGFRGMSVRQVQKIVGECGAVRLGSERMVELEFLVPRNPLYAGASPARSGRLGWSLLDRASRLLGFHPGTFAPHLNLVIEKTRTES